MSPQVLLIILFIICLSIDCSLCKKSKKSNTDTTFDHFSKYNDISFPLSLRIEAVSEIKSMFNFAFDSYMKYAFPHDELKPISGSWTDIYQN